MTSPDAWKGPADVLREAGRFLAGFFPARPTPPPLSRLAVAALITGLCGLWPVGLFLAWRAAVDIRADRARGAVVVRAAVVVNVVTLLATMVVVVIIMRGES
jgi:RsiW-degrading membrane proteinase PrsW (M82 family)